MKKYIGAIDQGTTSTRFIIFDRHGNEVAVAQEEHRQIFPRPGWVEHAPLEIWEKTCKVIKAALRQGNIMPADIASIGITNQRETSVIWNPKNGKPYCNAIVWQDTRTSDIVDEFTRDGGIDRFRDKTGLPLATYFSGPKLKWALDNIPSLRELALKGEAIFGTIDSWLIWLLTGGTNGGVHITDVTNASRTMLLDLATLNWDDEMLSHFDIPRAMLPQIKPSVEPNFYGVTSEDGPFGEKIPVAGILGDQQAALFGQVCYDCGSSKNTYGTGCFMLVNTGNDIIHSKYGLITTVGYQIGSDKAVYALEGSIAVAGALVQWFRDNWGLIKTSAEIETLAESVDDNGGVYFVPAFSGLYAPYWKSNARGVIAGLTAYVNKGHIARAVLEATAFQTREIFEAMEKDTGVPIPSLKVDGGMVVDELLMQFQSDILNVPVIRPKITETTALGAAYAAGLAVGFWGSLDELRENWAVDKEWYPKMDDETRSRELKFWRKAVSRTFEWFEK
jgi:glycerol kinase